MSIHDLSPRYNATHGVAAGIAGFVRRSLIEPVVRWQRQRATIKALSALDDRMLADIGITRSEIEQLSRGRLPRHLEPVAVLPAARPVVEPVAVQPAPCPEMKRAA